MVLEHSNYRDFLKDEFAQRLQTNPRYSLRAMAQNLGLSPATLSLVISGGRGLSPARALTVATKLNLKKRESDYFCLLVQLDATPSGPLRNALHERIQEINPRRGHQDLSVDLFKTIAEWHHFAILELTHLDNFVLSPQSASQKLGISKVEADLAIARLKRLDLLEVTSKGQLKKVNSQLLTESKVPNQALRLFHKQMLSRAIESLETQSPSEKIVGSETFAFDPSLIEQARSLSEEFFQKMIALAGQSKKKTAIYHFGLQLFNLNKERQSV